MNSLKVLLLFLFSGCALSTSSKTFDFGNKRPVVAAHRADHSVSSENSLEAVLAAQRNKIPLIEIDIHESADGELFLFHNKNVDPQTVQGPKELVGKEFSRLTSKEIRSLVLPVGEKVPSFDEILNGFTSFQSSLLLDIKGGEELHEKVLDAVKEKGSGHQFWFLCYDKECVSMVKQANIEGVDVIARLNAELSLSKAESFHPKIVQIDCEQSCSKEVAKIRSLDSSAKVLSTTLTDALDNLNNWKRVLADGVDILLTDKPLDLLKLQDASH